MLHLWKLSFWNKQISLKHRKSNRYKASAASFMYIIYRFISHKNIHDNTCHIFLGKNVKLYICKGIIQYMHFKLEKRNRIKSNSYVNKAGKENFAKSSYI